MTDAMTGSHTVGAAAQMHREIGPGLLDMIDAIILAHAHRRRDLRMGHCPGEPGVLASVARRSRTRQSGGSAENQSSTGRRPVRRIASGEISAP